MQVHSAAFCIWTFRDGVQVEKLPDNLKDDFILFEFVAGEGHLSRFAQCQDTVGARFEGTGGPMERHSVRDLAGKSGAGTPDWDAAGGDWHAGFGPMSTITAPPADGISDAVQQRGERGGSWAVCSTVIRAICGTDWEFRRRKSIIFWKWAHSDGAYGGKINGSGGGGCLFCYAPEG